VQAALARRFDRLEAARARVLAMLAGRDARALNRPPAAGAWSALQVLHHLVVSEDLTLAYVRKKMRAGDSLPRAGLASRLRLLALEATLASPLRFRAPAMVADAPTHIDAAELRARWDAVRRDWRELLESFPPELLGRLVFRHPRAGRMSLDHALGTLEAHLAHHVPQVESALRSSPPEAA
jgi:hypothetical protein